MDEKCNFGKKSFFSESFVIAALKDERFYDIFFEKIGNHKLLFSCGDFFHVLENELPFERIVGKLTISFDDYHMLDQPIEWERALFISGITCLDIYERLKDIKFNRIRPFLIYWIESDQWESIQKTYDKLLFDYLENEYPAKIAAIREC